jgi:galactonate dehydratase
MKIHSIQTLVCNARMRNWIFVKVITDQPGLFGWGEATLEWHTRSVVGAIEDLSQLLIGEDPTRIEYLWQMMHRQHFWHGNGIVRATAMAGIDLALWDILGKVTGQPCSKLWGGPVRDHIRTYCHLGGGRMEDFYETAAEDAARFADLAAAAVANGFTAFKSMAVPSTMPLEGRRPIRVAEQAVAAMREAVGESIDIMVDCHARPSPAMGLQFAKALEPYGLYFLEEPCWPESVDGLAAIANAVSTPIATGERVTHLSAFRDLFAARACAVCQLDITHCGGLSEARRIAALAEAWRLSLRASRWNARDVLYAPIFALGWALKSTKTKSAGTPFSRSCCRGALVRTAALLTGERKTAHEISSTRAFTLPSWLFDHCPCVWHRHCHQRQRSECSEC